MADVSGSSGAGGSSGGGGEQGPSGGADQPAGDICAVCLDPNNETTACYSSACPQHVTHKNCLLPWMKIKRRCPTCRARVTNLLMKSGEAVELPPMDEVRLERRRRRQELTSRILRLAGNFEPEGFVRFLERHERRRRREGLATRIDSDDSTSDSDNIAPDVRQELERSLAEFRSRILLDDSSSDSDSSLSDVHEDQPPLPTVSGVNESSVTAGNEGSVTPRLRQERPREEQGSFDSAHPAYESVPRFSNRFNHIRDEAVTDFNNWFNQMRNEAASRINNRFNEILDEFGQPRTGLSSDSFTSSNKPHLAAVSGINQSSNTAGNEGSVTSRVRQERPREEQGIWNSSHPAYEAVTAFNNRFNQMLDEIGQPRMGSEEFTRAVNIRLEQLGAGERRRREERVMLRDAASSSAVSGDQPPLPTGTDVQQPLDNAVNRNDITSERPRQERPREVDAFDSSQPAYEDVTRFNHRMAVQEEMEERRRRRGDRVWGPFEQVVWARVREERTRGEEESDGGGDASVESDCADQPCSSTMRQRIVRRKRVRRASDEDEETKKRRRM